MSVIAWFQHLRELRTRVARASQMFPSVEAKSESNRGCDAEQYEDLWAIVLGEVAGQVE